MTVTDGPIPGLKIIEPRIFGDDRGYFFESFNKKTYAAAGLDLEFVQDNQSSSKKGVVRGLHFQHPPFDQGKLVRVLRGAVLDVVVDIRVGSPYFGKHYSIELSQANQKMLWIPSGFAHGFASLEDDSVFFYKCTNYYHKDSEDCLLWNDPALGIDWGIDNPIISSKDMEGKPLNVINSRFVF